eukprot:jgi/Botrbrau1/18742/Bobra.0386s0065.1
MSNRQDTILRLKRKQSEVPPDDILLERPPPKRSRSVSAAFIGLSIENEEAVKERYQRLTPSVLANFEKQLPPDKLAALIPSLRLDGLDVDADCTKEPSIPCLHTGTGDSAAESCFELYDVTFKPGQDPADRLHLTALRSQFGGGAGQEYGGETAEENTDVVYDLYVRVPEDEDEDTLWQDSAAVVQLISEDGEIWAESPAGSLYDSDDSNAEGYYANSYPDEESDLSSEEDSCQSDGSDTSEEY